MRKTTLAALLIAALAACDRPEPEPEPITPTPEVVAPVPGDPTLPIDSTTPIDSTATGTDTAATDSSTPLPQ